MLFEAEGIHRHAGAARAGRAAQHAFARRIVDVLFLASTACIILGQVVESIIGEGSTGAVHGATGDIAPDIITAGVGLPRLVVARCTQAVEARQLVRVAAVAVEGTEGGRYTERDLLVQR